MAKIFKNRKIGSILVPALLLCYVSQINGQYYGRSLPCPYSYMDPDADCLAGIAGIDYPTYAVIPKTSFRCSRHPVKSLGYFADVETHCQVFHVCLRDGTQDTFLCPNGTVFNQRFLLCDWWFNVKCAESYGYYVINDYLRPSGGSQSGSVHTIVRPWNHNEPVSVSPQRKMDVHEQDERRTKSDSNNVTYVRNGPWTNMFTSLMGKPR